MFLSQLDRKTYKVLECELSQYKFDDLNNIERYHSLNLVLNNEGRRVPFISKLPDVLKTYNVK